MHGAPRGTIDVDLIVKFDEDVFVAVESALKTLGLVPRLPISAHDVFHFREEYIKNRNLIAWSSYIPVNRANTVDIIITENLADNSTVQKRISQSEITLLSKADLIKMKTKSGRLQDTLDIQALEKI